MSALVNIICTDEALLQQEACDVIIEQAKEQGITEREVVDVVDKFSWDELIASTNSLSLFAESKLMDIRFVKSPKKDAQTALVDLLQIADRDNQFLIRLPKIEKKQKNTKWFKAVSQNAQIQDLWPPKPFAFQDWLANRAIKFQLKIESDALALLAEQTEGNLLAASQNIEKLKLLFPTETVNVTQLKEVISDSARYSVFLCLDEALSGQGVRAVRMLHKFQQEAVQPISILVNLTREIGFCNLVAQTVQNGKPAMHALSKSYMWESKKKSIINASRRLPAAVWQKLSMRCAHLDRMIKGQEQGNIWQEMESCIWLMSGKKIWGAKGRASTR